VTRDEAAALERHRALVAAVVRVDDFAQDLGASLLRPVTTRAGEVVTTPAPCRDASPTSSDTMAEAANEMASTPDDVPPARATAGRAR
jgi:hypothetical protein